jgi:hypothetical protein
MVSEAIFVNITVREVKSVYKEDFKSWDTNPRRLQLLKPPVI